MDKKAGWGVPRAQARALRGVASEVTKILEENVQSGTGVGAYFGRPAAGKTGTTENHADAWFSGYTPQLQASVWVGYQRAEIPMYDVHGISVAGGTFPATIWNLFMSKALQYRTPNGLLGPVHVPDLPRLARRVAVHRRLSDRPVDERLLSATHRPPTTTDSTH